MNLRNMSDLEADLKIAKARIEELEQERDAFAERLTHLLKSETIRQYDKKDNAGYLMSITGLDKFIDDLVNRNALLTERVDQLSRERAREAVRRECLTRNDILDKAKECVSGHRQEDYGTPENNFMLIAELWTAYKGVEFTAIDVAMMMALLKIARISSGHGTKDSFVDLAGYAACGGEIALAPRSCFDGIAPEFVKE